VPTSSSHGHLITDYRLSIKIMSDSGIGHCAILPQQLARSNLKYIDGSLCIYGIKRAAALCCVYNDAFPRGSNGNSNAIKPDTINREAET
jgi:hypothetical protein